MLLASLNLSQVYLLVSQNLSYPTTLSPFCETAAARNNKSERNRRKTFDDRAKTVRKSTTLSLTNTKKYCEMTTEHSIRLSYTAWNLSRLPYKSRINLVSTRNILSYRSQLYNNHLSATPSQEGDAEKATTPNARLEKRLRVSRN